MTALRHDGRMRRDPEAFADQELELLYIAGRLEEAQDLESLLDQAGLDYVIRVEHYRSGIIFASTRAGAFFYVRPDAAGRAREVLTGRGYRVQESSP